MQILIAEDDQLSRRMLDLTVREFGHTTVEASNGAEALRILERADSPALAILDWTMPELDGAEVCRRIRRSAPEKPLYLILLTSRASPSEIVEGLDAGADDYLTKPFNRAELRARLRAGERIAGLQRNLAGRVAELENALKIIEANEAALREVRERQRLLETAVEQTDASILITDAELDQPGPKIVFVNPAFTQMTGYAATEIIGKTPRILQGEKTDREVIARLRRNCANGKRFFGETVNYRKDGTAYNLEWHIAPVRDDTGRVTNFISIQRDITARKRQETVLRESREYRNIFNLANDSIIIFDPNDEIVLNVNDKACENYRIQRENFIGVSLKYLQANGKSHGEMLRKLLVEGKSDEFETVHLRADGTMMDLLINSSVIEYEGQTAILSIMRDITDRRRAEAFIRRAKQEWSDTVDAVSDLIILTDEDGAIRRCNRATVEFFESSYIQIIGLPLETLLWQFGSDEIARARFKADSALRSRTWEGQLAGRAGWYEITSHRVPPEQERESGWVHIVKDITLRKQSEAALQRLNAAIEQAADTVIITDHGGSIQYVNPAFERTTQWTPAEAFGQGFFDLQASIFGEELRGKLFQNTADEQTAAAEETAVVQIAPKLLFESIARDAAWSGVYKARRRNGELYDEEATVSPVRDQDGIIRAFVAVCRDVSEKSRLESIAEAVNMMENVGYVFSGIRHELGNPINSVKTALTVLHKNLDHWQHEQIVKYIERCLTEIGRVEYLLRSLKTFSMHENPKMQPVALDAFLENFLTLIENDYNQRGIRLQVESGANMGAACADPRALHQVLLNLIANAADALRDRDEPRINIGVERRAAQIIVSVQDNGAGMNELQQENLFKPFYTSKAEGTGLGLVIVKKMIAKMNGTISIESRLGIGTTVRFTLEAQD